MKVSPVVEDSLIPMFAEDEQALREQKRKRREHWSRMYRAREQYFTDIASSGIGGPGVFDFWQYLEVNYGLVPERDQEGNITEGYTVTDEKLYTLFLLKFGQ